MLDLLGRSVTAFCWAVFYVHAMPPDAWSETIICQVKPVCLWVSDIPQCAFDISGAAHRSQDAVPNAILPLFELDLHTNPLAMMLPNSGDVIDPMVEADFLAAVHRYPSDIPAPARIERYDFYDRARSAYAILMTGEVRPYGNLLIRKGITPVFSAR